MWPVLFGVSALAITRIPAAVAAWNRGADTPFRPVRVQAAAAFAGDPVSALARLARSAIPCTSGGARLAPARTDVQTPARPLAKGATLARRRLLVGRHRKAPPMDRGLCPQNCDGRAGHAATRTAIRTANADLAKIGFGAWIVCVTPNPRPKDGPRGFDSAKAQGDRSAAGLTFCLIRRG